jgi:hypothetical protein
MKIRRHHPLMFRKPFKPLEKSEATDDIGECRLQSVMAGLGWRFVGHTKDSDNQGVDYVYRLGTAEIDIQLKSSRLNLKRETWDWKVFSGKKRLDMKFYDRAYTFLFLAGIKLVNFEDDAFMEIASYDLPQVALIPGKVVVKYFTNKTSSNRISLSLESLTEEKKPFWKDFLGVENIYKLLVETKIKQEEEEEFLEKRRKEMGQ